MTARRCAVVALTLLLTSAACGGPPRCPRAPARIAGPPFLWRVESPTGSIGWLFGTVHNAGVDDAPAAVWPLIDMAPVVVTELGDTDPDPELMRSLARVARGPGIDTQLPADDWWELTLALDGVIKVDDLRRACFWYAMSLLTARQAPSPSPSLDDSIVKRARAHGRPVRALESWGQQLTVVAAAVTVDDLSEAIGARATMRCDITAIREAYAANAEDELAIRLNVAGSRRLLVDRNQRWLPMIEAMMANDSGGVVAVGVSHLLGDGSVVALLSERGYRVERAPPLPSP